MLLTRCVLAKLLTEVKLVNFTLEVTLKAHKGNGGVALLLFELRRYSLFGILSCCA